ncbi:MAG: MFS transporter [Nitrospinae bacterium]|nr:MFS transporter [Nitrospinota bacterium]
MSPAPKKLAIFSWSLYDFANTIFSMNVISLYFALWVTVDKGGQDIFYSTALSLSMFAVAVSVPVFGAISDNTGKRQGPLTALTLLCVICTALIGGVDNLWAGLFLFAIANYCYQSALVFYNGMMPSVSQGSHVGLVSGYGVALGYLGSIAGMLMVKPYVDEGGRSAAFLPTAMLVLFFALPCFFFVKDPEKKPMVKVQFKKAFSNLKETFSKVKSYKRLFQFITIHFLVLDAVNTIIAFMSVYASKVIGFNGDEIMQFLISSTVGAMVGSVIIGFLVKHKGTTWTYWLVLWLWIISLSLAALSQSEALFWCVGPLAGVGMGGVWVVSRAILIELSPPEKLGEFFGLYGFAGKAASILGPMLWGSVVWALDSTHTLKYRIAVSMLLCLVLAAAFIFRNFNRNIS